MHAENEDIVFDASSFCKLCESYNNKIETGNKYNNE